MLENVGTTSVDLDNNQWIAPSGRMSPQCGRDRPHREALARIVGGGRPRIAADLFRAILARSLRTPVGPARSQTARVRAVTQILKFITVNLVEAENRFPIFSA